MSWTPINPTHSIERVRVILQYREAVPSKLSRQMSEMVAKIRSELRFDGPTSLSHFSVALQVGPEGQNAFTPVQTDHKGWQFARKSAVGNPLELIAQAGEQIIYETTEYRKWSTFRQRFGKIAADLAALAQLTLDTQLLSLEYFDRFVFSGPKEEATPTTLLAGLEHVLHPDALSGRTLWHLHKGWYEGQSQGDVLVNQNFDASDLVQADGQISRAVTTLTKLELRADRFPVEDGDILSQLDFLHELSKSYFVLALRPEMRPAVGIF